MSSLIALYGCPPPLITEQIVEETWVAQLEEWVETRKEMDKMLREQLVESQNRMKLFADIKRTERTFLGANLVLLKLQSYHQSSVAIRKYLNLAPKFCGPFQVEAKIRSIAYQLQNVPRKKYSSYVLYVTTQKVYWRSQPKRQETTYYRFWGADQGGAKNYSAEEDCWLTRKTHRAGRPIEQVLVKWLSMGLEETTWKDWKFLKGKFPHLNLGDKLFGKGDVRTWLILRSLSGFLLLLSLLAAPGEYSDVPAGDSCKMCDCPLFSTLKGCSPC